MARDENKEKGSLLALIWMVDIKSTSKYDLLSVSISIFAMIMIPRARDEILTNFL